MGCRRILITSPTGMGKSRLAFINIGARWAASGKRVVILTNRRVLTSQTGKALSTADADYGVVAAGYDLETRKNLTVCSIQTLFSRVAKMEAMELPPADLVIVDEAHGNKAGVANYIMTEYLERGAIILGITATPVGLAKNYDHLIVAGTNSSGRACGALVPCDVFAPDEPDMKGVKKVRGEYVQGSMAERVMETIVFADVFKHWRRLNPMGKPTILFAPGVKESLWFRDEFQKLGVQAEHIDGDTPESERQRLFVGSRERAIPVICSCGVLREGADLPWAEHGILVQACCGLSTYLQIVGRLLRSHPGKQRATLQDHSGAWHRHGSPNSDRDWDLADTDVAIAKMRKASLQRGEIQEGIRCPACSSVRKQGPKCPFCGHEHIKSVRVVRMLNGELKKMHGPVTKKRPDRQAWTQCLYACGLSGRTLNQAAGLFKRKCGRPLPVELYPKDSNDWHRPVADVYPFTVRRRTVS